VTDGKKMEGYCSTGQSPPWAVVPVEEEEEKLVHLIGATIGIHYDAWTYERQISCKHLHTTYLRVAA
jgi:hypothetical protein